MKCRVCGNMLRASITDLPFKVSDRTIVILKDLPVEQRVRELEKENARLRMERDILKKATAYFAKEHL